MTFCSSAPTLLRVLGTQALANTHGASPSTSQAGAAPWRMLCRAPGCGTCTQGGPEMVFSWAELFCPPCMCRRASSSDKSTATDLQKRLFKEVVLAPLGPELVSLSGC